MAAFFSPGLGIGREERKDEALKLLRKECFVLQNGESEDSIGLSPDSLILFLPYRLHPIYQVLIGCHFVILHIGCRDTVEQLFGAVNLGSLDGSQIHG